MSRQVFACEECGIVGAYRGKRFCSRSCRTSCLNRTANPMKRPGVREKLAMIAREGGYAARLSTPAVRAKATSGIRKALTGRKQTEQHVESRRAGWLAACAARGGMSEAHKKQLEALHNHMRGENHPGWQGGITPQRKKEYQSEPYKAYRREVLKRDKRTCQVCGQYGGNLDVHHCHLPYAQCKGPLEFLKYHPANGQTLCEPCHYKTQTYRPDLQQPKLDQLPDHILQLIPAEVRAQFDHSGQP